MKTIRIGNDIYIKWTITRFSQPEDFSDKQISVKLYDKYNNEQVFEYQIEENVISGIFFGKDQTTNGVYRLLLTENEGQEDMVTLDYIDCFLLSNKMKNQTSNGSDSSSTINTELQEVASEINLNTDLSMYAKKTYVDEAILTASESFREYIPTKVSDLEQDINYLTTHQDISGKADKSNVYTKDEVDDRIAEIAGASEIPSKVSQLENDLGFLTQHQSLANYYTKTQTDSKFQLKGSYLTSKDLVDYAKTSSIPTKLSQLTNDRGFLTEHQSLTNYATKSYVAAEIAKIDTGEVDLSAYVTKVYLSQQGYLTSHQSLDDYATKSYVVSEINKIDIPDTSNLVSKTELSAHGYLTSHQSLDNYYNKNDINGMSYMSRTALAACFSYNSETGVLTLTI